MSTPAKKQKSTKHWITNSNLLSVRPNNYKKFKWWSGNMCECHFKKSRRMWAHSIADLLKSWKPNENHQWHVCHKLQKHTIQRFMNASCWHEMRPGQGCFYILSGNPVLLITTTSFYFPFECSHLTSSLSSGLDQKDWSSMLISLTWWCLSSQKTSYLLRMANSWEI